MRAPYIIGEAGSCHDGSLERALELIQIAKSAGCDAVKFQYWSSPDRMRTRRHMTFKEGAYDKGSISQEWFTPLREAAHTAGLNFLCTVYLPEDVVDLVPQVDGVKVASFESRDKELMREVNHGTPEDKPIFVSSGMSSIWDTPLIRRAIRMHCVSAYPCPYDQANLGAIERGMGYSDHTCRLDTGAYAVSAGANYLEVHFRAWDTHPENSDVCVSHDPQGLEEYVMRARTAAVMRGDGRKRPQPAEEESMKWRVR